MRSISLSHHEYIHLYVCVCVWSALWHITYCRLFNTKSSLYIYIYIYIPSRKKQNSFTLGLWIYFHPAQSIDMNQSLWSFLEGIFALWYHLHCVLYKEYLNIRILNNLIVPTDLFPIPDLLDWKIPQYLFIYIYIYIYMICKRKSNLKSYKYWYVSLTSVTCLHSVKWSNSSISNNSI